MLLNSTSPKVCLADCAILFFLGRIYCSVSKISLLIERLSQTLHIFKALLIFLLFMWLYILMN